MADGLVPAIDKVGAPAPGAPEAEANAPTMPTTVEAVEAEKQAEEKKTDAPIPDGAGPMVVDKPKPVEVVSVPQTPLNDNTPAGGSPRPVLKTVEEPTSAPAEPTMITGVEDPVPLDTETKPAEPKPAEAAVNGNSKPAPEATGALLLETDAADENAKAAAEDSAAVGDKRKADEAEVGTNGDAASSQDNEDARSDKKAKLSGDEDAGGINGKAKKVKKAVAAAAAPLLGKTARKTRSQGPADAGA